MWARAVQEEEERVSEMEEMGKEMGELLARE